MKLRRPIFIPEVSCEKKCEMNEWMNEWDLSQAKTSATDNRLQSQTKCLTFNPKIYYCETAKERNMLMRTKIRSIYL